MTGITINGITLNPEQDGPALQAFGFGNAAAPDTDFALVVRSE